MPLPQGSSSSLIVYLVFVAASFFPSDCLRIHPTQQHLSQQQQQQLRQQLQRPQFGLEDYYEPHLLLIHQRNQHDSEQGEKKEAATAAAAAAGRQLREKVEEEDLKKEKEEEEAINIGGYHQPRSKEKQLELVRNKVCQDLILHFSFILVQI